MHSTWAETSGTPLQIASGGTVVSSRVSASTVFGSGNIVIVTQQAGGRLCRRSPTFGTLANIGNAQTGNYRYDIVELSLSGSSTDQGDLTDIVQFGAPISMTVQYTGAPDADAGLRRDGGRRWSMP